MDQLKETLRLRWQVCLRMGPPKEKLPLRWRLWTATFRLWLSDLHVRICLMRYCLAIYRREFLAHQHETARIRADYWKERYQEDEGG